MMRLMENDLVTPVRPVAPVDDRLVDGGPVVHRHRCIPIVERVI
jgi:hypothetical protein